MSVEELVAHILGSERVSVKLAEEATNYGIVELMSSGASYYQCLLVLERAQTALLRHEQQHISFGNNPLGQFASESE